MKKIFFLVAGWCLIVLPEVLFAQEKPAPVRKVRVTGLDSNDVTHLEEIGERLSDILSLKL